MNLTTKIGGVFTFTLTKPNGESRSFTFNNLIVNSGLDWTASYGALDYGYLLLGTGTTAPTPTDTTMGALVGFSNNVINATSGQPTLSELYGYVRRTYRFNPGVVTGNLSEVGIGNTFDNMVSYSLFARALIKDGSGNPTTITVLPQETLDVTYEVRYYLPLTDSTGTVTIAGVPYNWTARAGGGNWSNFSTQAANLGVISYDSFCRGPNAALGNLLSQGSGSVVNGSNPSGTEVAPYSPGTYYVDVKVGWNATNGDSEIWFFYLNTYRGGIQILLDAGIPKSNLNYLELVFRQSWSAL